MYCTLILSIDKYYLILPLGYVHSLNGVSVKLALKTTNKMSYLGFIFQILIKFLNFAVTSDLEKSSRVFLYVFHPNSPNVNILQNHRTMMKMRKIKLI